MSWRILMFCSLDDDFEADMPKTRGYVRLPRLHTPSTEDPKRSLMPKKKGYVCLPHLHIPSTEDQKRGLMPQKKGCNYVRLPRPHTVHRRPEA